MKKTIEKKALVNNEVDEELVLTEYDIECLLKSEEDIEKGRTVNYDDFLKEWKAKYGF